MSDAVEMDHRRTLMVLWSLWAAALLLVAIYNVAFNPEQFAAANGKAFGCYTTAHAAPIRLDKHGMTIMQRAPIRIGFQIDRPKNDFILNVDAPIAAEQIGSDYVFSIKPLGVGRFWDFVDERDGFGVRDENALRQFTVIAGDGKTLRYKQVSPSECGG